MIGKSKEETQFLAEATKRKDDSLQHEFVWGESTKLNLYVVDQIKAMKLFAEQLWNVSALKSMDESLRMEYVLTLIRKESSEI
ncbi:hypothetical protein TIFTF001_007671 [Ficus carica]|uniref:Uncharacterized protein n=1 Tax=Ficus carica TaxID=3494 RepID=A0AA87ZJZ1_FICCA|nr:hypothetical protein TIFTF001_007671 [Ficus carica]